MPLESTLTLVRRVGKRLNLSDIQIKELLSSDAEHQFEIALKNGGKYPAYRVQHDNRHGPYKGGIRFHPGVNLDEVRELALLMTLKTAAVGLPLGGGKGGVAVDPKQLSDEELEELSRAYVSHLAPHIGPDRDIPAPDVSTDARVINWMVDEYERQTGDRSKASFTGKPLESGGSEGREAATGRGGVIALKESLKHLSKTDKISMAIQGFGNVGSFFGTIAQAEFPTWRLVAASDSSATIVNPFGLDGAALSAYKVQGRRFKDFTQASTILPADNIINRSVDVLVLAALGDAITESNMKSVKARVILELANGPISDEAYNYLSDQGVTIIPDILANSGGVIVSYQEWLQNKAGEHWDASRVNQELQDYMTRAMDASWELSQAQNIPLKEAAVAVAINRLIK